MPFDFALLIPIVAILIGGMIAVASIMSAHQRKMAEMLRNNQPAEQMPELVNELQQMRNEMQVMRGEIHQTAIAVDDIKKQALPSSSKEELSSRMTEEH